MVLYHCWIYRGFEITFMRSSTFLSWLSRSMLSVLCNLKYSLINPSSASTLTFVPSLLLCCIVLIIISGETLVAIRISSLQISILSNYKDIISSYGQTSSIFLSTVIGVVLALVASSPLPSLSLLFVSFSIKLLFV